MEPMIEQSPSPDFTTGTEWGSLAEVSEIGEYFSLKFSEFDRGSNPKPNEQLRDANMSLHCKP